MAEHNHGTEGSEENSQRRINVAGARQMLGMIGKNYDDEDILEILEVLYGIAEEGFEEYSDDNGSGIWSIKIMQALRPVKRQSLNDANKPNKEMRYIALFIGA